MNALAVVPRGTEDLEVPDRIHSLPIEFVTVGPNVRVNVAGIEELAASIAEHGVLQPIKVRHAEDGASYVVTWGQRRLLASQLAGKAEIPAIIDDAEQTAEARSIEQLIENLHRADLPALDRARAMRTVVDSGISQADLARTLGIAPSTVANDLGLLEAPAKIRKLVEDGTLTPAHAKALKGLSNSIAVELAETAVASGWSAHETERRVQIAKDHELNSARHAEAEQVAKRERESAAFAKIAELATKIPLATPIVVSSAWYGRDASWYQAALTGQGFTDIRETKAADRPKQPGFCDCTAYLVEIGWQEALRIKPACIVQAHTERAYKADRDAEAAERAFQDRVRGRVQELITEQALELFNRSPETARIFLWIAFDWSLNDWVRDHKGDRKKPNAWDEICALPRGELAVELALFVRKGFSDRYNVKLDWPRIARELGIETPA